MGVDAPGGDLGFLKTFRARRNEPPDLHRYKHHRATRAAIQERLREPLRTAHARGKQIMLIAHSMGSIIAYEVLRAITISPVAWTRMLIRCNRGFT